VAYPFYPQKRSSTIANAGSKGFFLFFILRGNVRVSVILFFLFNKLLNDSDPEVYTKSVGMGANPNARPGDEYEGYGMPVKATNHSKDTPTYCMQQKNVDEQCVNDKLEIGKPLGCFIPPFNDCQRFVYSTVNKCRPLRLLPSSQ
jgi:hypothetical protein